MESRTVIKVSVSLCIAAALLMVFIPRNAKFPYDYKKGSEWQYETLYSEFEFPLEKSDGQYQSDLIAARKIIPYYIFSQEIADKNIEAARSLDLGMLSGPVVSELKAIYDRGVLGDDGVRIKDYDYSPDVIYVQRNKHALKIPATEVWTLSAARAKLRSDIEQLDLNFDPDSLLRAAGVYSLISPNLFFDNQNTAIMSSRDDGMVGMTSGYVAAGERIVSQGEIVTSEVSQVLDSYKREYEANLGYSGPVLYFWFGNYLIALAFLAILFFSIFFVSPSIFDDSRFFYILMVYLMSSIGTLLMCKSTIYSYCLAPFSLAALFLNAFFRRRVILPVYSASLVPMLVFAPSGAVLFVVFLLSGVVGTQVFRSMGKGWKQFLVALIIFGVQSLTFFAFWLTDMLEVRILWCIGYLMLGSLLSVIGYSLVPLFELVFNLVSNSRLQDLCDSSNSLIRDLERKAPGTFQHSLQVMNMADVIARAIDANPILLRAGALYHDIGKIENPMCFVENESLLGRTEEEKYHYSLTPAQSSQAIIKHVTDGVELARKHHLPEILIDFISTHHGSSHTGYFFSKYISEGGDPQNDSDFRYPGKKPVSKEQVVLMLCDSIEAASRSLNTYTQESISEFVEHIVNTKRVEGQLNESDITLKEISTFKRVVKQYLLQMHHGRVEYPDQKRTKFKNKK